MNDLSHEQAREYIQQGHQDDWAALRQHLAACDECRAYATLHVRLLRELPVRNARAHPTVEQRAAVLTAAGRGSAAPRFWRPLAMAGGFAAVLFMATAFWLVLSAADPSAARPRPPAPLATFLAPFLPDATATARPTQPAPTPTPAGTPDPRGRYVIDTVPAPSLAGNLIGEPLEQQVIIYLPPSYDTSDRRYPVVYALMFTEITWYQQDQMNSIGSIVRSAMNIALRNGAEEMIVVAADSVSAINTINYFLDSPVTGDWEAYLANDLVGHIDAHYRTVPTAEARGLYAEGPHGLGGLMAATHHSDIFSALYLNNPTITTPETAPAIENYYMSNLARSQLSNLFAEVSMWPEETAAGQFRDKLRNERGLTLALRNTVAYGLIAAPDIQSGPPFFQYPYATAGGPADEVIMQKWHEGLGNIRERIAPYQDALRSLDIAIVADEGNNALGPAYLSAQLGPAHLSAQLNDMGIDHTFATRSYSLAFSTLRELSEYALTEFFATSLAPE